MARPRNNPKKKGEALLLEDDLGLENTYLTPQALKRQDEPSTGEPKRATSEQPKEPAPEQAVSIDLAGLDGTVLEHPIATFRMKLLLQGPSDTSQNQHLFGTFTKSDGVFLQCKMAIEVHHYWTSNIRVTITASRRTPSPIPAATAQYAVLYTWTFRLTAACSVQDLAIYEYPKSPTDRNSPPENFFFRHCLSDTEATRIRNMGYMALLRFTFDPQHAHTASLLVDPPVFNEAVLDKVHRVLTGLFGIEDGSRVTLTAFLSHSGQSSLLNNWAEFDRHCQVERHYAPLRVWFQGPEASVHRPDKFPIHREFITPPADRPKLALPYQRTYRDYRECWTIEGLSIIQADEQDQQIAAEASRCSCELRLLSTTAGGPRQYLGLLRLPADFQHRFGPCDHFELNIHTETWVAYILPTPFIYASTIDVSIVVNRPLTAEGWSQLELDHVLNLSSLPVDPLHTALQEFCYHGPFTTVSAKPVMSDKVMKTRLAAIKLLNPAHLGERDYHHNGTWQRIILAQDLRTLDTIDVFGGADIFATLAEWGYTINDTTRAALEYFRHLPNQFGIIKGPWGTGKTWLDVLVTLLLLSQGKKVKVLSPSNKSADSFVLRLNEHLDDLRARGFAITEKKVVRLHAPPTERDVVRQENERFVERESNPDRQRWVLPDGMTLTFYDSVVHNLIQATRRSATLHGVRDRRYKLHEASLGSLLLAQAGVLDRQNPYDTPTVDNETAQNDPPSDTHGAEHSHGHSLPQANPDTVVAQPGVDPSLYLMVLLRETLAKFVPDADNADVQAELVSSIQGDLANAARRRAGPAVQTTEPGVQTTVDPCVQTATDPGENDGVPALHGEPNVPDAPSPHGSLGVDDGLQTNTVEDDGSPPGPDAASQNKDTEFRYLQAQTKQRLDALEATSKEGFDPIMNRFREYFTRVEFGEDLDIPDRAEYREVVTRLHRRHLEQEIGVVVTTLINSGWSVMIECFHADHVIVQEAATAENADVFTALAHHRGSIHLSGDDEQLGPPKRDTADNCFASATNVSLFERLHLLGYPTVLLSIQYRTIPLIGNIISSIWYEGKVTSDVLQSERPNVAIATRVHQEAYGVSQPMAFVTHSGPSSVVGPTRSKLNETEITLALNLAARYITSGIAPADITILAPYLAHIRVLRRAVLEREELADVGVSTVDNFQGDESSIVILCLVGGHGLGFMSVPNRLLSACSRVRDAMVVFCNYDGIMSGKNLRYTHMLQNLKGQFEQAGALAHSDVTAAELDFVEGQRHLLLPPGAGTYNDGSTGGDNVPVNDTATIEGTGGDDGTGEDDGTGGDDGNANDTADDQGTGWDDGTGWGEGTANEVASNDGPHDSDKRPFTVREV